MTRAKPKSTIISKKLRANNLIVFVETSLSVKHNHCFYLKTNTIFIYNYKILSKTADISLSWTVRVDPEVDNPKAGFNLGKLSSGQERTGKFPLC